MATLPTGGAGRTATLGTGTRRTRSVGIGAVGRDATIDAPVTSGVGAVIAFALVTGATDFLDEGDGLLLETGDNILLETGEFLLLETGVVVPSTAILDTDGLPILDTDGDYILEP